MAALELIKLSFFHHHSSSPNPPTLIPFHTKLNLTFHNFSPKLAFNSTLYPLPLPLSKNFHVCLSSSTPQQISVEEEKLEETQKEDNKRKLFVLNLPWSLSVADVKNLFGECGTVADVEIIKREDGKKGFAFITMSSGEEALAAINKFDSHELLGRIIRVEYAKKFKAPGSSVLPRSNETRHKLFVSNLAWKARATNLKQFFAEFNPVSTRVVFGPSGSSAGYGFVSFSSQEEAEAAISALNGKELLGRPIILKRSEKSSEKSETDEENSLAKQPDESGSVHLTDRLGED